MPSLSKEIYVELKKFFMCQYDETQSIGKRYRRQDEIGTPYCITIDYQTIEDKTVTVRDRDTMKQNRVPLDSIPNLLKKLLFN